MGVEFSNQLTVICDTSTVGGATYWVSGNPTCFRLNVGYTSTGHCANPAGMGTDHPGYGGCSRHQAGGRQSVTARYATVSKRKQRMLYDQYVNDPDMLNLVPELALLRSILADSMINYNVDDKRQIRLIVDMINQVTQVVERIEKIQSQQVLTITVARLIMLRAIEVAKKFVPEQHHYAFVNTWKREVLAETELALPSESVVDMVVEGR